MIKLIKKFKDGNVFVNASIIYIIANGVGQGATLLANVFFTRYMSQMDYGLYSNYYSYVSLLVPFVGINLYCGLANAYIDYKKDIYYFRSSVLLLSVIGFTISLALSYVCSKFIGATLSLECIVLAIIHAYGFFMINYYIQSMNMENRYVEKGLMLAIPNVLQALFAGIAVVICNTYISRAIGSSIGIVLPGLVASCVIIKKARPKVCTEYWKYVLRISLPAIIGSVASMVMQQCDKVMITSIVGAETTAIYALVFNVGYILYAVQQATNGVWTVWIYNTLDKEKYGAIPKVQKWYLYMMLVIVTGLYMISPEIIKVLAPQNYWKFEYIPPFIIGSFFMAAYTLHMSISQYEKKTGVNSAIVMIAAFLNIVLNYLLIPIYGGVGAAYTSVISYGCVFLLSAIYLKVREKYFYSTGVFFRYIGGVCVQGGLFYLVKSDLLGRYILFGIIIVIEICYLLIKKDEILKIVFRNEDKNDKI